MVRLDLMGCGFEAFPKEIASLLSLKKLNLAQNRLSTLP
jgi:Leucine-rich repeat (LRR) protein